MGRGGILLLGAVAIGWTWLFMRAMFPDKALILTALCGIPQAALAVKLFIECKCGDKKSEPSQTKA